MKNFLLSLLFLGIVTAIFLRIRYGGGEPYPDLSTPPRMDATSLEEVLRYPEPIGNVAVSNDGRVFFTVHPESRPKGNKLLEWVNGAAEPYPSGAVQAQLFDTVLGVVIDRQNRLWSIDHGNYGFGTPRLLAFDLANGDVVHDYKFAADAAPPGSFLQDLQVTADGTTVFAADASLWRKKPAIVVYDIATRNTRRVLESHPSVVAQNYIIRTERKEMSFLGGLLSLKGGVDGIALGAQGEWLYYGAINNDSLYRVRVGDLTNRSMADGQLANRVERYSDKPLSDGLSTDATGRVYVTDVEHGAVAVVDTDKRLTTLIRSKQIRWADALSFGPDGWLYVADSALPEQILQSTEHMRAAGPYHIYRVQTGAAGIPGQ